MKEYTQQAKELLENFLGAAEFEASLTQETTENRTKFVLEATEGQQLLIGKQGATLDALQHLLAVLAKKQNVPSSRLDINGYQKQKDQSFLTRVEEYVGERAESRELLLWPMSSFERRLVHEHFLGRGTHETVSEDFGSRRVVRLIKK
jgi:predicted RNA-binding protein Jag